MMNVKNLKEIIEAVSIGGFITDFVLKSDGSVKAIDTTNTFAAYLKHNECELDRDIGIESSETLNTILTGFLDDTTIDIEKDNALIINENNRKSRIALIDTKSIKVAPNVAPTKQTVTFNIHSSALKNLFKIKPKNDVMYKLYVEDGKIYIKVGNESTFVEDNIGNADNNVSISFAMDTFDKLINKLNTDITVTINDNTFIIINVFADNYTVSYIIAGYNDISV